MSDISKADLKKEIQEILKDADLDNTSAKKVGSLVELVAEILTKIIKHHFNLKRTRVGVE